MKIMQYSKRVCKWSLIGVFALVIVAMALVVFACDDATESDAVVRLVQYFSTLAGVVTTGYFGRASLEDFAVNKDKDKDSEVG